MSPRSFFSIFVALMAIILGAQSVYIITEIERAVLLRLGKVVDPDIETGLHFKIPFVDEVRRFDARVLTLDARAERFLTVEKKSVQVDSFAKWRISGLLVGVYLMKRKRQAWNANKNAGLKARRIGFECRLYLQIFKIIM